MTGPIPEANPSDEFATALTLYQRFDLHTRLADRLPDGELVKTRTATVHLDADDLRRAIDARLAEVLAGDGVARLLTPIATDGCVLFPASGLGHEAPPFGYPSGTSYVGLAAVPPGWTRLHLRAHVECPQSPEHWTSATSSQLEPADSKSASTPSHGESGIYGSTLLVALFTVQPTVPNRLNLTIRYLADITPWIDVIRNEFGNLWEEAGAAVASGEPITMTGGWSHLYTCETCAGWVAVAHSCMHSTPSTKPSWVALAQRLEIGVSTLHRMRRDHETDARHKVPAAELMVALAPCEFCRQPEIDR